MSVATSTAIGLGIAGAGLVGGVASSAIGANAAGNAASTQANSSNYAAQLQAQEAQNALNFQEQQYGQGQQNLAPWLQSGTGALSQLDNLLGISPQSPSSYPTGSTPAVPNSVTNGQPLQTYNGNPATLTQGQPAAPGLNGSTPVSGRLTNTTARPTAGAVPASPNTAAPASGLGNGGALNPSVGQSTLAGLTPNISGGQQAAAGAGQNTGIDPATGFQTGAGGGYGSLSQGWNQEFQAPTAAQAAQTPGYQFALQQGQQALQNSAAAKGGLLSGNTAEALDQYSQGLADSNYQQTYNNALGQYQSAYNQFQNNQANTYNRLAGLAGTGQTAAGQLNSAGQSAAANIGNISQTAGQQIGQSAQNAGAATASGYAGVANALNGGISSATGSAQQGLLLSSLLSNNSYAGTEANPSIDYSNLINSGVYGQPPQ
jgi:hypothetical protein